MAIGMMDLFGFTWPGRFDPFETALHAEPGMRVRSRVLVT